MFETKEGYLDEAKRAWIRDGTRAHVFKSRDDDGVSVRAFMEREGIPSEAKYYKVYVSDTGIQIIIGKRTEVELLKSEILRLKNLFLNNGWFGSEEDFLKKFPTLLDQEATTYNLDKQLIFIQKYEEAKRREEGASKQEGLDLS